MVWVISISAYWNPGKWPEMTLSPLTVPFLSPNSYFSLRKQESLIFNNYTHTFIVANLLRRSFWYKNENILYTRNSLFFRFNPESKTLNVIKFPQRITASNSKRGKRGKTEWNIYKCLRNNSQLGFFTFFYPPN